MGGGGMFWVFDLVAFWALVLGLRWELEAWGLG